MPKRHFPQSFGPHCKALCNKWSVLLPGRTGPRSAYAARANAPTLGPAVLAARKASKSTTLSFAVILFNSYAINRVVYLPFINRVESSQPHQKHIHRIELQFPRASRVVPYNQ